MKDKQIERKCDSSLWKYLIRQHTRSHICLSVALNEDIEMKEGGAGCAAPVGRIRYWIQSEESSW